MAAVGISPTAVATIGSAQAMVTARWRAGSYARVGSAAEAIPHDLEMEFVDVTPISHYFPISTIVREMAAGFTKSVSQ